MEKDPVIRLKHLSSAQKNAYRIADNRLTELGTWSIELLQAEFKAIEDLHLDVPLILTGYDMGDIDLILEGEQREADPKTNQSLLLQTVISFPGSGMFGSWGHTA